MNLVVSILSQWCSIYSNFEAAPSGILCFILIPRLKANPAGLTKRELEVSHLLAQGQRDKLIARSLNLSERTVHHHVSAVLGKLSATSPAEAILEARKLGIL